MAPRYRVKTNEIKSPNIAFPYMATKAIVGSPSPVKITGKENTINTVKKPKGSPYI